VRGVDELAVHRARERRARESLADVRGHFGHGDRTIE
jgi:hypothetical protein